MEQEIELRELFEILAKRKTLIILLVIGAVVASFITSQFMTPIYETSTTIIVEKPSSLENPFQQMLSMDQPQVADFAEILRSRSLLYTVAKKLDLVEDENSQKLKELAEAVSVQSVGQTNLIRITVESPKPEVARDLANGLAQEFITQNELLNRTEARGAKEFIEEQLKIVSEDLAQAEEALRNFQIENQIFAPEQEVEATLNQLTKLETMQAETLVSLSELESRQRQVNAQLETVEEKVISSTTIARNPLIQALKTQLNNLEIQLAGALEKYTDEHPTVVSLRAEIEEIKARMKQEAAKVVTAETETLNPMYQALYQKASELQVEELALQVRNETLAKLIAEQEQELVSLPDKQLQLTRLMRNAKVTEEIYVMLKKKYEEVKITEAMKTANVRVVDEALSPTAPIRPKVKLNVLIAAFLALFVGVGLAFAIEFLDTTIKTPEEVEELLGLPVLGQIPSYLPEHLPDK
ncbi:MAG: hypothetical protein H0Z38_04430 [Firmicutes bacterium]|nr:hypothetical protein [Bacillota bacterium]